MVHDIRPAEPGVEPVVVSEVEPRRSRWNRARVAFWVVTVAGGLAGGVVASPWWHPLQGVVFGALVGAVLGAVVSAVMTAWPVLRVLWHWLPEMLAAGALVVGGTQLVAAVGRWWAAAIGLAVAGLVAGVPVLRRRFAAWVWCAVTRHRLRVCFAAFIRARNRLAPGTAPLILLARPTPAGERVWVWLRTGLDVAELEARTGKIAVACWASEVQVTPSRRWAALVRVDVTRRDPLTLVVASPLVRSVPGGAVPAVVGEQVDVSRLALDLADVPEEPPAMPPARRRRALPASTGDVVGAA